MANDFKGRGNLGTAPTLKHVDVDGERRAVAQLRVYFDRSVPDGNGGFADRGGFWLDVNLWGPKAEAAAKVLAKGARVAVTGTLVNHEWADKDSGEPRARLEVQADHVDLDLSRVESIRLRKKESADEAEAD
ncbi:single-stranded DNA-binding protein [Sulfurivermis fontis]|uniref:single-stranded DNA-binding protein n=1 Tax=Sulfurivermis fontis TaxID=1972068 RepID=UPI000FDA2A9C|nr:single-stranded DNA-binding protein [Sulfurivermis fontis]